MTQHTPDYRGFRGFAVRHPITTLLVVGLGLAYALITLWGLAYHGVIPGGRLHEFLHIGPEQLTGALATIPLFPAALYVTWAAQGRAGVKQLFRRMLRWRVSVGWWITALLALPVLTTGITLLFGATLKPVDPIAFVLTQAGLLLVNLVIVNLWEEATWAGVFQTRLERGHSIYGVAVLSAVPFALAHVPLEFFSGGAVTIVGLLIAFLIYFAMGVLFRPMLATVLRGTGDSLLLVALVHSVFNRTNAQDGVVATLTGSPYGLAAMPIAVVLVFVVAAIVVGRRRLSRDYRRELDERNGATGTDSATAVDLVRSA